ncbi:MAG TPA: hypothetical protein DCE41_11410 [Cytophagales bacterium]|nr:hypothetical protein [Cytophagales bacterium]HAA22302.1 hypothetical protein [Cytophagales bacterium]
MKLFEALSTRFSIRQIFGGFIAILSILLLTNFLAFNSFNVSNNQLAQYHHANSLYYNLLSLSPQELTEQYPNEHYRQLIIEAEKHLELLSNGGYGEFLGKEIEIAPPQGAGKLPLERIQERWPTYRDECLMLLSSRADNINGNFTIPVQSDLPIMFERISGYAQELLTVSDYILVEKKDQLPTAILVISLIAILVFILMLVFLMKVILNPLKNMENTAGELAKGHLQDQITIAGNNEIANIGSQINKLAQMLENALSFTKNMGQGNLDTDYLEADDSNSLAVALMDMRTQMKSAAEADRQRNWASDGLAKFAEILRLESDDLSKLGYNAVSNLVRYVGAQQGSIFIATQQDDETILEQIATFAYDKQKFLQKSIKPGDGIVGQAYLEEKRIYLLDIPEGYLEISAGLGHMPPKCLLVVPLIYNEEIQGIVEIASLEPISDYKVEFVESVGESIAANISTVKNNERTRNLLVKSQEITEKMRVQEDEMRQNMEEMQNTYREMITAQKDTEQKEANLNALINNTEDSIVTVDRNYRVMIINDVLKRRYKGTQYEGIDIGQNVLDTLGAVREEWKGYYDRALAGERLDFVIRSTVNNEDSFRRYHINPVRSSDGDVIGCSVFSRDVTDMKVAEIQNKKLISDLTQKDKLFEAAFFFMEVGPEKRIITINDLAAMELGYQREDLIGRDINDLFISRDTLTEGLSTMHKGDIWKEEVALLTKDGSRLMAKSVSTAVVDNETERIVKYILVFYKN